VLTTTIEEVATPVITEAAPLTASEGNSLIAMAAAAEKRHTVKAGTPTRRADARAWSRKGQVD
jgi:hypothetical protein